MQNFTDWLEQMNETERSDFDEFLRFVALNREQWPKDSENPVDYVKLINAASLTDEEKVQMRDDFNDTWEKWSKNQKKKPEEETRVETKLDRIGVWLAGNAEKVFSGVVIIVFVGILGHAFVSESGALARMNDIATARGAITFLFALGTITLAVMLVGSSLFTFIDSDREFKRRKERFNQGKEILSILIGILGTIVGFYFGAINGSDGSTQALSVSVPQIINSNPAPGETFSMVAQVQGGKPPYEYNFKFNGELGITPIENMFSTSGLIVQDFEIPASSKPGSRHNINLSITDATDRNAGIGYTISIR